MVPSFDCKTLLLGALLACAGGVGPPLQSAHAAEKDQSPQKVALVEIDLLAEGTAIHFSPQTLEFGAEATFVVLDDDHEHKIRAKVLRGPEAEAKVVLGYQRDRRKVFDSVEFTVPLGGPASTQPAGGESKVKLRVSEQAPKPQKIAIPDGDDPLAGVK